MRAELHLFGDLPPRTNLRQLRTELERVYANLGGHLHKAQMPVTARLPGALVDVLALPSPFPFRSARRARLQQHLNTLAGRIRLLSREPSTAGNVVTLKAQAEAFDAITRIFERLDRRAAARATAATSSIGDRDAAPIGVKAA